MQTMLQARVAALVANAIRAALGLCAVVMLTAGGASAPAAETVRLAVQKTGTLAWEVNVIRHHAIVRQAGLTIEALELASPEAGKIALRGGSADVIVSDWLWVSRERSLGSKLVFYPYSSTVGAVMTASGSPIRSLADLKGKSLAVAGGPLDKSWLLLQAVAKRQGIDLKKEARIVYGAPTLLAAKMEQGAVDAMLNYWNLCARLEAHGYKRMIEVEDLLKQFGVDGRLSMLGYAFDGTWAAAHPDAVARFLAVTKAGKEILATSDDEWRRIAPLVHAAEPSELKVYRERYRAGIPDRPIATEEADARKVYRVLAEIGGKALVGDSPELAPGVYYRPPAQN